MTHLAIVLRAYGQALGRWRLFVAMALVLRLLAAGAVAPVVGLLVALAARLADRPALTDQDIALFAVSPGGFLVTLAALALFLLAELLGVALMAAALQQPRAGLTRTAQAAAWVVLARAGELFAVAGLFVLRVLALIGPFALVGLLVVLWYLSEFDANYYLTFRPPQYWLVLGVLAVLGLGATGLLLRRLADWALVLHLVLFERLSPQRAFAESARRMQGKLPGFALQLTGWVLVQAAVSAALAALAGLVLLALPLDAQGGLSFALAVALVLAGLFLLAGQAVTALALGALAVLLQGFHGTGGVQPELDLPSAANRPMPPTGGWARRLRLAVPLAVLAALGGLGAGWLLLGQVQTQDRVQIIAHRGASALAPENTLAAVERAIADGADWVEIDVQETADGAVVVAHDSDLMRIAGRDQKLWRATLAELADLDVGSWFDPAFADQRVPRLEQVLDLARDRTRVLIELKYHGYDEFLEERVIRLVEAAGMADQVAVMSLSYSGVLTLQRQRPEWQLGVLAASAVGNLAGLQGEFLAVRAGMARPSLIRSVKAAGKELFVWTVNDPLQMSRMISMGVDGVITDDPALAHRVLAARAQLSSPERLVLWLADWLGLDVAHRALADLSP